MTLKRRLAALEQTANDRAPVQAGAVFFLLEGESEESRADIIQARNEGRPVLIIRIVDAKMPP